MKNNLSIFDKHQIKVAKDTLKMPDAIVNLIGGITKKQAKEILNKFKTTKNKKETA